MTCTARGHVLTWESSTGVSELSPFKATCDCGMVALGHRRATSEEVAGVPDRRLCADRHTSMVDELTCRVSKLEMERDDARRWAVRLEQEIAENRGGEDKARAWFILEMVGPRNVICVNLESLAICVRDRLLKSQDVIVRLLDERRSERQQALSDAGRPLSHVERGAYRVVQIDLARCQARLRRIGKIVDNHRNLGADRMAAQILDELTECGTAQYEDPDDTLIEHLAQVAYEVGGEWLQQADRDNGRSIESYDAWGEAGYALQELERSVVRAVIAAYHGGEHAVRVWRTDTGEVAARDALASDAS